MNADPLWPRQRPYAYASDAPTSPTDAAGLKGSFPGATVSGSDPVVSNRVNSLCTALPAPWPASYRNAINNCLTKAGNASGTVCPGMKPCLVECLRNWCQGTSPLDSVTCAPCCNIPSCQGACACTPLFSGGTSGFSCPTSPTAPQIVLCTDTYSSGGCNFSPRRTTYGGFSSLQETILHEMLHSCGIAHGVSISGQSAFPDRTCNEIYSCFILSVIIEGNSGSQCWSHF